MAKYKVLKTYFSGMLVKELVEGEVLELNDADSAVMDARIELYNDGYLEKVVEEKKKRVNKTKEEEK